MSPPCSGQILNKGAQGYGLMLYSDPFESKFEIVQMSSLKHSKVIPDVIDCESAG